MIADFHVGQGDDSPSIEAGLLDENGDPIDGTGVSSVRFRARLMDKSRPAITGTAVVVTESPLTVRYDWPVGAGQTAVPGLYEVEWVDTTGGRTETFSNNNKSTLWIAPRV